MKITFGIVLFLSYCYANLLLSQNQNDSSVVFFNVGSLLSSRSSERGIPFRTQSQIDSIQMVAEGYMVFNTTTGCLNYYFGKKWYEICGTCIPKPQFPKIDSIVTTQSKILIYYQHHKMDSLVAILQNKKYSSTKSPLTLFIQTQIANSAPILLQAYNPCGMKDTTIQVNITSMQSLSPILTEEIDGKKIRYRKYGNCKWMVDDFPSEKPIVSKSPQWVSMENNKNPCPKGWLVPTEKDWLKLLEFFEGNYAALFETPTDENITLGLKKSGIYLIQEKNIVGSGTASYWVGERKGNKHKLINLTDNGHLVPEEDPKLFLLPLRCIQCEK